MPLELAKKNLKLKKQKHEHVTVLGMSLHQKNESPKKEEISF